MKNKTGRYLKYAIGEIILVVIGILIALSINNWNENNKLKIKEKEALIEILSDVENNKKSIHDITSGTDAWDINKTINSIKIVISAIETKADFHDSLRVHFNNTNNYQEFIPKTSGYESLASTGMDLISNAQLRSLIGEYFTSILVKPKIAYGDLRDDFYHYMLDYVRFDFTQKYLEGDKIYLLYPRNYDSLLNKGDYLESLKIFLDVNHYYRIELETALESSKTLEKEINNYLEKNWK